MPEQKQKKPKVDPITQSESTGMGFLQKMITVKLCEPFLEELEKKNVAVCLPKFEIALCKPASEPVVCFPKLICPPDTYYQGSFFVDFIRQQGKDIESMKESILQIKDEIAEIKKRIK